MILTDGREECAGNRWIKCGPTWAIITGYKTVLETPDGELSLTLDARRRLGENVAFQESGLRPLFHST